MSRLEAFPLLFDEACALVTQLHRHHKPSPGFIFAVGASLDGKPVGVAMCGRPVNRIRQDGFTLEVTRLATDGTRNGCSFLYGACARAAFALGYRRIGTYTLASEPGTSLRAAGWRLIGEVKGRSWSCESRPRVDTHPLQNKLAWECEA